MKRPVKQTREVSEQRVHRLIGMFGCVKSRLERSRLHMEWSSQASGGDWWRMVGGSWQTEGQLAGQQQYLGTVGLDRRGLYVWW